jgi:NADH-quinone oxidoreductase subunit N
MIDKIWFLIPELILFAGVIVVFIMGLSPRRGIRDAASGVTCLFLLAAFIVTPFLYDADHITRIDSLMPMMGKYVKMAVAGIGILLAMTSVGIIDRRYEASIEAGRLSFDPIRANRGEYYAFMLLSLIGVMLVCNTNDLIWLFLALELTSLPTYIMVAMSRPSPKAQEAAVKYFFLGALSAAMFLYGFALLYGGTGTIVLTEMRDIFIARAQAGGSLGVLATVGLLLSILGMSFKIAAAPMHFYAADVYEGAASAVTAFLAFVPKTAGFVALMILLSAVGWGHVEGLPFAVKIMLWMIAVLTMTLGNIGALLQKSAKRMLAYSSIAHSGYMLIGVIAGPAVISQGVDGFSAVLFYLVAYGFMNTAAFAVLAGLERSGQEIETLADLAGLRSKHGVLAAVMGIAAVSLLGFPPLIGFVGKLYLFIAGVNAGQVALVVIAGLNSAISAWYYLGLVRQTILADPTAQSDAVERARSPWGRLAATVGATAVLVLPLPWLSKVLIDSARSVSDHSAVVVMPQADPAATSPRVVSNEQHEQSAVDPAS